MDCIFRKFLNENGHAHGRSFSNERELYSPSMVARRSISRKSWLYLLMIRSNSSQKSGTVRTSSGTWVRAVTHLIVSHIQKFGDAAVFRKRCILTLRDTHPLHQLRRLLSHRSSSTVTVRDMMRLQMSGYMTLLVFYHTLSIFCSIKKLFLA